jgi:periplasmic divalent cation tolerance protein
MKTEDSFCLVITTVASEALAGELAQAMVQSHLAACVQVQPVRSFYIWKEQAHSDPEWLLFIKTRARHYDALEAFIRSRHGYEVPEIIQLPITAGSADYLQWIALQTSAPPGH